MDSMQEWELHLLADMVPWAHKDSYEQTRLLMWSILSPYFKKGVSKKPQDILPLETDKKDTPEEYTKDDIFYISKQIMNMKL